MVWCGSLRDSQVAPAAIATVAVLELDILCWPPASHREHRYPVAEILPARDLNDTTTVFVDAACDAIRDRIVEATQLRADVVADIDRRERLATAVE